MKISRIDIIGQNGNDGDHYPEEAPMTNKKIDSFIDKLCNTLEKYGYYGLAKKIHRWNMEK